MQWTYEDVLALDADVYDILNEELAKLHER